jgi:hypothetical protein
LDRKTVEARSRLDSFETKAEEYTVDVESAEKVVVAEGAGCWYSFETKTFARDPESFPDSYPPSLHGASPFLYHTYLLLLLNLLYHVPWGGSVA